MSDSEATVRSQLSSAGTTGAGVRAACRNGALTGHTSGLAPGLAQANLVILPKEHAYDFLLYCIRNPKPCPLLEVSVAGDPILAHTGEGKAPGARSTAPGTDLRTDLPRYCVWKDGVLVDQPTDISHLWRGSGESGEPPAHHADARGDWVAFLLGCSFSFEEALLSAGLPVRHLQEPKEGMPATLAPGPHGLVRHPRNVPMYCTSIPTAQAGPFHGPCVVSMRPMTREQAQQAADITAQYPRVHGRCVHIGDPAAIGIPDVDKPDYGDKVTVREGEVPVFWACGVTPQAALLQAKLPIAITHAPGHMLVLDVTNEALAGEAKVL